MENKSETKSLEVRDIKYEVVNVLESCFIPTELQDKLCFWLVDLPFSTTISRTDIV